MASTAEIMSQHQMAITPITLGNPKRDKDSRRGRAGWYEYYAGFSPSFVRDAIALSPGKPGNTQILDPWNGSGTTTDVGTRSGFDAIGFDLNPVMVLVAKARSLQSNVHASIMSLLEELLLRAGAMEENFEGDPLATWLSGRTSTLLRRIEAALQALLIDSKKYRAIGTLPSLDVVSALAAFFYVALFSALKQILKPFRLSNPTWIKDADPTTKHIDLTSNELNSLLRRQVSQMADDLAHEASQGPTQRSSRVKLDKASSLSLPLDDASVQLVITSPPYCTRIDYVVKTRPELALLGMGDTIAVRQLRELMIGTPTISKEPTPVSIQWGRTCVALLDRVAHHKSRASISYYLKNQIQYFSSLYKSLGEIDRTLASHGQCFFVVQDSYYKELHIDLAQIVREMGDSLGWSCNQHHDFPSSRTMVGLNRGARTYNDPPKLAVETVLHFTKMRSDV
jgi:SAM-dependent methyltransferase